MTKKELPTILYANFETFDPEFIHIIADEDPTQIISKGKNSVGVYKLIGLSEIER